MDITQDTLAILDQALNLQGRAQSFVRETPLLGALPELDSMAVLAVLSLIEERFNVTIDDDEVDGATFATVGTLIDFLQAKFAA